MKRKYILLTLLTMTGVCAAHAANVSVTMNSVSTTMTLATEGTGEAVTTGEPASRVYTFEAPTGKYILTAYGTDGTTVNGTLAITVTDEPEQEFKVFTATVYATNRNEDKSYWTVDAGDYTTDIKVTTREGVTPEITVGQSVTTGRQTFVALHGYSYAVTFNPSESHIAEGYTSTTKTGGLTFNATVSAAIPQGNDYVVTVPAEASFELGTKSSHFVDFSAVAPVSEELAGGVRRITYYLAQGQVYNYRTSLAGGLTRAGYFTNAADEAKRPVLTFAESDYTAAAPGFVNHDATANDGYETGDILVNINARGHLCMEVGQTFKAHAMRSWELTDNSVNNYFIEPDFHYTVIGLDGKPSDGVITVTSKPGSAWADITATGAGTAIVLVTYDAIGLNYYTSAGEKKPYMGGETWGAIWPKNTAVYVVSVGATAPAVETGMVLNAAYNEATKKLAGEYVDAEHDVFYYLDSEEGASYTFTPAGVKSVTVAYPAIGATGVSYSGFATEGVTANADGSCTVLLKEGRQIVCLADADGNAVYQVLTARPCHREVINVTTGDNTCFMPGDEVKVQFSGLRHPANKLAGIYNMRATVAYHNVPEWISLDFAYNQYTFGSSENAQAVSFTIPADLDMEANGKLTLADGTIEVSGFGDPIGNHRSIDPVAGRSPNFSAIAHETYFGRLPELELTIGKSADAADAVITTAAPTGYVNMQGMRSGRPFHGLNIVLMSDGTSRKQYID